jgi:hypothetical protein
MGQKVEQNPEFRILEYPEYFRQLIVAKKLAIDKLIEILNETFLTNSWASTKQIIQLTSMGSYNQRIQEMRDVGILIECRRILGEHYYQLQTDLTKIDWDDIRLRVPDVPIPAKNTPSQSTEKKQPANAQGSLL